MTLFVFLDGVNSPPMSPMRERSLSGARQRTFSGASTHSRSGNQNNNVNRQISVMSTKSVASNASEIKQNGEIEHRKCCHMSWFFCYVCTFFNELHVCTTCIRKQLSTYTV